MPFDGPIPTTKPDLRILSEVLRGGPEHPMWPDGFVWNFHECGQCAMGLAGAIWGHLSEWGYDNTYAGIMITNKLVPDRRNNEAIFMVGNPRKRHAEVTPADVADAIDEYLGSRSDV